MHLSRSNIKKSMAIGSWTNNGQPSYWCNFIKTYMTNLSCTVHAVHVQKSVKMSVYMPLWV